MSLIVRKAVVADVKPIHTALLSASAAGLMLPRSLSQLYAHIRDFTVLEGEGGSVLGFCALAVVWDDISEIRSLFLDASLRGQGLGRMLIDACVEEARVLGTPRVFTLTYQTGFFAKMGFVEVGKDVLPQKIWADCIHCPQCPECDETAMQRYI